MLTPDRIDQIRANAVLLALRCDDDLSRAYVRDVGDLLDEVERLTPKWRDGKPPAGQVVWRDDGASEPHVVVTLTAEKRAEYEGDDVCYWDEEDGATDWGTARWCPIPKPTEG